MDTRTRSGRAPLLLSMTALVVAIGGVGGPAIAAALNADKIDGIDSTAFATKSSLSTAGAINSGQNPVDWTKLKGVPASLTNGDAGEGSFAGVQYNGTDLTGGETEIVSTFGWTSDWVVHWYAVPTSSSQARLTTSVTIQNDLNGNYTYLMSVRNDGSATAAYTLRYFVYKP